MEYNNSFDALIKKAVENAEMPMPADAWNEFEKFRTGGVVAASGHTPSFVSHFIAAGVALAITVGIINYASSGIDSPTVDHSQDLIGKTVHSLENDQTSHTPLNEMEDVGSTIDLDGSGEVVERSQNVTDSEKEAILRINEKLKKSASYVTMEETESTYTKAKRTTKYVGKDFNLDAPSLFSPNGDGTNDSFIPTALTKKDKFEMVVRDDNESIVFKTSDVDSPWDGQDMKGKEMPEGKYHWSVMLKKNNTNSIFRGSVKLIRR